MLTAETKIILLLCYYRSKVIQRDVVYQGHEVLQDTAIVRLSHATSGTHNLQQICCI